MKYDIGMDVSTLIECEGDGVKYYDKGEEKDLLSILKDYGTNSVRLRLWNDPYDENGEPYGGGTCDMDHVIKLARRSKELGLKFYLDIHYSDFWADPYKQYPPKAWQNYNFDEIVQAVYDYSKEVLTTLIGEDLRPDLIQVGNEITYGMLWPYGVIEKRSWKNNYIDEYEDFITILKSAIKGVREIDPTIPIVIHLERSWDNAYFRWYFDELTNHGVDFDAIGFSYYPYWHYGFDGIIYNMTDMHNRYNKDIYLTETSYAYTTEHFDPDPKAKRLAVNSEFIPESKWHVDYPLTREGQRQYYHDLLIRLEDVPGFKGIYVWEPGWIPSPHSTWASWGALKYLHQEDNKPGNEWANQCLFDYEGNALPALEEFKLWGEKHNN